MSEYFETIIIGAGQAGLAMGYHLSRLKRDYVILEQASSITPAWRSRWDSFTLVLPNWTLQMPNFHYQGEDPDGFLTRDEMVSYMEQFVATFHPDIRFNSTVTSIESNPSDENFIINTTDKVYEADNVIVATGTFQTPKIPVIHSNLSKKYLQLHTSEYNHPEQLPEGAVLVVGSGQSGCQITEELYQSGRKVYLCVGRATRIPRFYRGKDSIWWLKEMKFFDQSVDMLPSPKDRFKANPFLTGKDGGRSLDLHQFAKDGVTLLGRLKDARSNKIFLAPDLHESLQIVDDFVVEFRRKADDLIVKEEIDASHAPSLKQLRDGYDTEIIQELDLTAERISSIIWATGYQFDYSWIQFPILDEDRYPIQDQGVSEIPGLYFVGLNWLYRRRSGLPWGVGEDAAHVAEHIDSRLSFQKSP